MQDGPSDRVDAGDASATRPGIPIDSSEDHVFDASFWLEKVAQMVDAKRKKVQDLSRLAEVAELMDWWTRSENEAYAKTLDRMNLRLQEARVHESCLLSANNQMAAIIIELESYLDALRPQRARFHSIRQLDNGVLMPVTHILPEIVDLTSEEDLTEPEVELMEELMDF